MLRPNEIYDKSFEKTDGGYYSAKEVDAFMSEVAASYEQVFKQNGELVRRLSLLANRLEAYRRQEEQSQKDSAKDKNEEFNDSLKAKLDQAREVAQKMLDEAKVRAGAIVDNANAESDRILVDLKNKIKEQKVTLDLMNAQSDAFKKKLLDSYREHLLIIDSIPTEAEKIVKSSKNDADEAILTEKKEYTVDTDNSDIFAEADSFAEKLDNPDEVFEEVKENAEITAEDAAEVQAESDDIFDETEETAEQSAEESNDIFSGSDDIFSSDEAVEEAINDESASEESEETAETQQRAGFDFDFSGLSFDDEEDEDIFDEEDEPESVAEAEAETETESVFEAVPSSEQTDAAVSAEKENLIADVFSVDDDSLDEDIFDKEYEEESDSAPVEETASEKQPSLKDLIRAKGSIDNSDIEIIPGGDLSVESSSDDSQSDDSGSDSHFHLEIDD